MTMGVPRASSRRTAITVDVDQRDVGEHAPRDVAVHLVGGLVVDTGFVEHELAVDGRIVVERAANQTPPTTLTTAVSTPAATAITTWRARPVMPSGYGRARPPSIAGPGPVPAPRAPGRACAGAQTATGSTKGSSVSTTPSSSTMHGRSGTLRWSTTGSLVGDDAATGQQLAAPDAPRLLALERVARGSRSRERALGADRLGAGDVEDVIGEEERGQGAVAVGATCDRNGRDRELVDGLELDRVHGAVLAGVGGRCCRMARWWLMVSVVVLAHRGRGRKTKKAAGFGTRRPRSEV